MMWRIPSGSVPVSVGMTPCRERIDFHTESGNYKGKEEKKAQGIPINGTPLYNRNFFWNNSSAGEYAPAELLFLFYSSLDTKE